MSFQPSHWPHTCQPTITRHSTGTIVTAPVMIRSRVSFSQGSTSSMPGAARFGKSASCRAGTVDAERAGSRAAKLASGRRPAAREVLVLEGAPNGAVGVSRISPPQARPPPAPREGAPRCPPPSPISACPRPWPVRWPSAASTTPFAVQPMVVPDVLDGHDVLVKSPTGSGKTFAFGVPMADLIDPDGAWPVRAGARPDARARRPDRRRAGRRDARPRAQDHRRLRRRRHPQPGQAGPPLARAGRDPRPAARPDRPRRRAARPDPAPRARRGRPDARHGLQARRRPHRRDDAATTARRCSSPPRSRARSAASPPPTRDRRAPPRARARRPRRSATWSTASGASRTRPRSPRSCTSSATPSAASRSSSCAPSAAPTGWSSGSARTTCARSPCTATSRSPSARRRSRASSPATSTRSWRPTSPRAGSTSPASRTSSTTTRPAAREDYVHRTGRTARAGASGVGITFVLDDQARDVAKLAGELGLEHGLGVEVRAPARQNGHARPAAAKSYRPRGRSRSRR